MMIVDHGMTPVGVFSVMEPMTIAWLKQGLKMVCSLPTQGLRLDGPGIMFVCLSIEQKKA